VDSGQCSLHYAMHVLQVVIHFLLAPFLCFLRFNTSISMLLEKKKFKRNILW